MLAQVGQQRLAVFGALGGGGLLGVCWAVGEVDGSLSQGLMDEVRVTRSEVAMSPRMGRLDGYSFTHAFTHILTNTCMHAHTHAHTHTHTYIHAYTHIHTHKYIHEHKYTHTVNKYRFGPTRLWNNIIHT